jgi:hypothetical protein
VHVCVCVCVQGGGEATGGRHSTKPKNNLRPTKNKTHANIVPTNATMSKSTNSPKDSDTRSMLCNLPQDAILLVFGAVKRPPDKAALCLATPRMGIVAMRTLEGYLNDPLLSVALALRRRRAPELLDERLLRKYAHLRGATPEGCTWLRDVAAEADWRLHIACGPEAWHLWEGSDSRRILLRRMKPGVVLYYNGEVTERVVRVEFPDGQVKHFEGSSGAERLVR